MKKHLLKLVTVITLAATSSLSSQNNNPAPYCASTFDNNYNMMKNISVAGTSFSLGAAGSWMATNSYTFYNNAVFPNLTVNAASTISIGFYSAQDAEPRYFALWIDYNNNNTFDGSEIIMQNANTTNTDLPVFAQPSITVTKTFTVPLGTTPGVKRMRVVRSQDPANPYAAYTPTFTVAPCNAPMGNTYGCTYDFTVNVVAGGPALAPVAQFSANITNTVVNSTINFSDQSSNAPTAWKWTITPATYTFANVTSGISQNPQVTFTAAGTYTVKLKASNNAGADSLTKTSYIKITSTVGIPELNETPFNVQVFPNPVTSLVTISLNAEVIRAEVLDNLGRTIHVFNGNSSDISALPAGIYFIKVTTPTNKVIHKKIMKE